MESQIVNATEYRNVSLTLLSESKTNPRRIFEDNGLKELAASIRMQGVLSPLLVRPLTEHGFEIVAGARRFRAAQIAEADSVPVRIVDLSDAQALESQLIETCSVVMFIRWKKRRASVRCSVWTSRNTPSSRSPRRWARRPPM